MTTTLNVGNLTDTDVRVQLVRRPGATIRETETLAPNPSLVLDDLDGKYSFCLKGKVLAVTCEGATASATVDLSGNFDLVINGKTIVENMPIEDIVQYFSQGYINPGDMGDPYQISLTGLVQLSPPVSIGTFTVPTNFGGPPGLPQPQLPGV